MPLSAARLLACNRAPVTTTSQIKFFALLQDALGAGVFVKLTLSAPRNAEPALKNIFVRPVQLKAGLRMAFTYRYATRDILKNLAAEEAVAEIKRLLGDAFMTANLFTTGAAVELTFRDDGSARLNSGQPAHDAPPSLAHDHAKARGILQTEPWLRELGVTNPDGRVREAMGPKFRQINQFVEVLRPLLIAAFAQGAPVPVAVSTSGERVSDTVRLKRRARRVLETPAERAVTQLIYRPLTIVDMGCGKGYLTFAVSQLLDQMNFVGSHVVGVETRPDLVEETNRAARACGFERLHFQAGTIASAPLDNADALIALHACDTATDDALARGIGTNAQLLVVSPCCHKELRPQIVPPRVLAPALRHGILLEREAEFATDALRAALLEWAGYDTKVFEFISTEHTAKNLMIAAVKRRQRGSRDELAERVKNLADFYGVREQRLASLLSFSLEEPKRATG